MGLVLADTNTLIYFLKGIKPLEQHRDDIFAISEITEIELLGVKDISKSDLLLRESLIESIIIYPITPGIKSIAISLKQQSKIKIPDALIAATSIYFSLPLLTADKGFKNIPGLTATFINL